MTLGTALIRRPGPGLADGIVTHMDRVPVDVDLAVRQWDAYVTALADSGWDLIEVPAADDCPDGVFVEDTVVMYRGVAVLTRPGADARRPEVAGVAKVVESLGCPVVRIEGPGTLAPQRRAVRRPRLRPRARGHRRVREARGVRDVPVRPPPHLRPGP
jgi:dimethylargininase